MGKRQSEVSSFFAAGDFRFLFVQTVFLLFIFKLQTSGIKHVMAERPLNLHTKSRQVSTLLLMYN